MIMGTEGTECNGFCWKFCNGGIPCDQSQLDEYEKSGELGGKAVTWTVYTGEDGKGVHANVNKDLTSHYFAFNYMGDGQDGEGATCPYDNVFGGGGAHGGGHVQVPWFFRGEYYNAESKTTEFMDCQALIRGLGEDDNEYWPLISTKDENGVWIGGAESCDPDAEKGDPLYHENCHFYDAANSKWYTVCWAITVIFLYLRMLQVLIFTPVGSLVKMFRNMLGDVLKWIAFISCLFIGFSAGMYFVVGDTSIRRFQTVDRTFFFMLKALMGDVDWAQVEPDHPWDYADKLRDGYMTGLHSIGSNIKVDPSNPNSLDLLGGSGGDGENVGVDTYGPAGEIDVLDWFRASWAGLILMFWTVLGVLLLVNLLIAMMASTYQQIKDHTAEELTFMKTKTVIDYDHKDANLPTPFNILMIACVFLWLLMDHLMLLCTGCFVNIHILLPMNDEEQAPPISAKYNDPMSPNSSQAGSEAASPEPQSDDSGASTPRMARKQSVISTGEDEVEDPNKEYENSWLMPAVGETYGEKVLNGFDELWRGAKGGWYCGFCNSWIKEGRQNMALTRYFMWYEQTQSTLDSEDKQRLHEMKPNLCPVCFRPLEKEQRLKVISELLSYWIFAVFIYVPFSIVTIPFWLLNKWSSYLSTGFEEVMECNAEDSNRVSDLGMPSPLDLKNNFKNQDTYCDLFSKDHNIWQFVNLALGVTLNLKSRDFDWGFQVDRTLTVISVNEETYADQWNIKAGMKIVAINGTSITDRVHTQKHLDTLTDGECPIKVRFSGDSEGVENDKTRAALSGDRSKADEDDVTDVAKRLVRIFQDKKEDFYSNDLAGDDDANMNQEIGERIARVEKLLDEIRKTRQASTLRTPKRTML